MVAKKGLVMMEEEEEEEDYDDIIPERLTLLFTMPRLMNILAIEDIRDNPKSLLHDSVVECMGTFFLVFFGCGCASNFATPTDLVQISLGFGFIVASVVCVTGPISGGHVNPAVTIGLFASGKIGLIRAILYIVMQLIGGLAAGVVILALIPEINRDRFGTNSLWISPSCSDPADCADRVTPAQGFGIEYITTTMLVLVVLTAIDDCRENMNLHGPLIIGITVGVCHLLAIPFTGCGINPARTLGPAVAAGKMDNHWLYWVGPILGGVTASLIYRFVSPREKAESSATKV